MSLSERAAVVACVREQARAACRDDLLRWLAEFNELNRELQAITALPHTRF